MQELTFVGLSEDGSRLLLALNDGRRFALPIDERLRAATRGAARSGQMAIPTETLSAKDVQARIRAGATTEEVADAAGWPLNRVEAFAVPILQERAYVAQQARSSLIRFREGESPLLAVVTHRLMERAVDPADLRWDAWRTEDGHWTVLLAYPAGRGDQVATWVFDTESRTLHPVDEEARWLSEFHPEPAPEPVITAAEPDEPTAQIVNLTPANQRHPDSETSRHPALRRQSDTASDAPAASEAPAPAATGAQSEQAARSKRATVPSWDEILFGGAGEPEADGQR
jgi:hypothetical protein